EVLEHLCHRQAIGLLPLERSWVVTGGIASGSRCHFIARFLHPRNRAAWQFKGDEQPWVELIRRPRSSCIAPGDDVIQNFLVVLVDSSLVGIPTQGYPHGVGAHLGRYGILPVFLFFREASIGLRKSVMPSNTSTRRWSNLEASE